MVTTTHLERDGVSELEKQVLTGCFIVFEYMRHQA